MKFASLSYIAATPDACAPFSIKLVPSTQLSIKFLKIYIFKFIISVVVYLYCLDIFVGLSDKVLNKTLVCKVFISKLCACVLLLCVCA